MLSSLERRAVARIKPVQRRARAAAPKVEQLDLFSPDLCVTGTARARRVAPAPSVPRSGSGTIVAMLAMLPCYVGARPAAGLLTNPVGFWRGHLHDCDTNVFSYLVRGAGYVA